MHVCLFDIDGTLLDSGGAGQAAMEAALKSEFGATGPLEGLSTAGRTDRAITADLLEYYDLPADARTFERFAAAYFRHLPEHLAACGGLVLSGVGELLETLAGRDDVLVGLLTGNFREGARLKLEHFRLSHHFELGGYGDRHLDRNDVARDALAEVHRRLDGQVRLERVWVIGDTPHDVRCGRAIGAKVVGVATGVVPTEDLAAAGPDHLLPDFADPQPLLRLLR